MSKTIRGLLAGTLLAAAGAWAADALPESVERYRLQKYQEAETMLRADIDANPEDARAHEFLGRTLAALKRADEAEQHIAKAEELGASEAQLKIARAAVAIERRDVDGAVGLLNEAAEAEPENAEVYHYRGMVKTNQRDFQAAVADLEKAVALDPARAYSHYYLGLAYNGIRRPDKMAEHLNAFVSHAPDAPDADKVRSVLKAFR